MEMVLKILIFSKFIIEKGGRIKAMLRNHIRIRPYVSASVLSDLHQALRILIRPYGSASGLTDPILTDSHQALRICIRSYVSA
jgi:hypothetical protein